jgi:hypothetical protein
MKNFENIHYPFFGLYKKPEKITFNLTKIFIHRTIHSHQETVDDKTLDGDYFARLLQIEKRLDFDCTCKNLAQLIFQRPRWGMDSNARPCDLSDNSYYISLKLPIKKVRDNFIWFDKISYPFEIPTQEKLEIPKDIYGVLISVSNEWYIKEFTLEDKDIGIRKKILL